MAEPYLTDLTTLTQQIAQTQNLSSITCKHFFSGAAAYVEGQIFMSLSPAGLALKLPDIQRDQILQQGGKPLKYFPKAPIKKDYAVLSDAQREDTETFLKLLDMSRKYVLEMATKEST
ncbi:TfoX/Sxy family protein [Kiloniella sp.]|uniref:TfoX/Sxy family protein n=1 Tax=Kiloniella sp. TaxID=1938587 RepID=UPI003B01C673